MAYSVRVYQIWLPTQVLFVAASTIPEARAQARELLMEDHPDRDLLEEDRRYVGSGMSRVIRTGHDSDIGSY